jgi:hypothetical protein
LSLLAVSHACWNYKAALTTDGHASNTNIPAFDDFTNAELELEWFALGVC